VERCLALLRETDGDVDEAKRLGRARGFSAAGWIWLSVVADFESKSPVRRAVLVFGRVCR